MTIPDKRILNLAGFLMCAALMGYALYAQYFLMLEPCPLCILQRIAVVGMGLVFLLAALHNPGGVGRFAYASLLVVPMSLGAVVAGRHAWLQMLPEEQVPACGPGLDYMWENFPLADVINMVFRGSGECADVDWQLLGLSMPAWVFVAVIVLGSVGIWNNARSTR